MKYVNGERVFWQHGQSATLQEPVEGASDEKELEMEGFEHFEAWWAHLHK